MRYRELLQSCLSGEVLSVSPVSAWRHKPQLDQTIEGFAKATVAEQRLFDFDFVKLTPASTWQSIDNGLVDCWNHDYLGRREIVKHNITQYSDWACIPTRNVWQGFTGNVLQAAKLTKALLPAQVPLLVTVFNPFFQAVQQSSLPLLLQTQQAAPAFLAEGLNRLLDNTLSLITALIELGVDGIFFVSQHASSDLLCAAIYQKLALQADLTCIAAIEQLPFSMLHLHGENTHWPFFAGIKIPLHCDKTNENELAQQLPYFDYMAGVLDANLLFSKGSELDVMAEALAKRRLLAQKRYILSPGCAIPLQVPPSNIHALVAAARTAI